MFSPASTSGCSSTRAAALYPGLCGDPFRGGYQADPKGSIANLRRFFLDHPRLQHFLLPFSHVHNTASGVPAMAMQKAGEVPFCTDGYLTRPHKDLTGGQQGGLGLTAAEHVVRDGLVALVNALLAEYEAPSSTFCYYTDVSAQNFGVIDGRLVLLDIESINVECTDGLGRPGEGAAACGRFTAVPGVGIWNMTDLTPREAISGPGTDVYPPLHVQNRLKFQTIAMLCALVNNIDTVGRAPTAMDRSGWFSMLRPGPMDVQQAVDGVATVAHATDDTVLVERLCRVGTAGPPDIAPPPARITRNDDTCWAAGCVGMDSMLLRMLPTLAVKDVDSRDPGTMGVCIGGASATVIGQGQYGIIAQAPGATCVVKLFRYIVGGPVCMYCTACRPGNVFHYCHDCGMAICFQCWGGHRPTLLGVHLPLCTRLPLPNV